jgi:hypothetical protein
MSVIEALSFRQLNRLVIEEQLSKEQLQLISDSIKNLQDNWGSDLRNMLDYEKLYAKNMLCGMVYEKNSQGKIRLSRHRLFVNEQSYLQNQEGTYNRRRLAKLGVVFVWFYVPSSPQKIGEIVDDSYKKYYDLTEPSFDWNTEPDRIQPRWNASYRAGVEMMTSLPYPAYFQIHETYIKYLSLRRGSRLLVAINQYKNEHGTWPESLEAIKSAAPAEAFVDPVTGNQLQYENHGERFSLYGEATNIWPM